MENQYQHLENSFPFLSHANKCMYVNTKLMNLIDNNICMLNSKRLRSTEHILKSQVSIFPNVVVAVYHVWFDLIYIGIAGNRTGY